MLPESENGLPSAQPQDAKLIRLLLDNLTDYAVFFMDNDGLISLWGAGPQCIFGYEESEILGQLVALLFTPDDRHDGAPERELRRAIERGKAADERWYLRKDGTPFWANSILTSLRDEEGQLLGFAKILRESSEQILMEEMLLRSFKEVDEKVKEQTQELKISNKEAESHHTANRQIKEFLRRVVNSQEEERQRISRDLHDHLGQQMTAMRLRLDALQNHSGDPTTLCQGITELSVMLKKFDEDLDYLAWELRPADLEHLGLTLALEAYVREWSENYHVEADFLSLCEKDVRLPREAEINLYRIVQEALNNTLKYAEATQVSVTVNQKDSHLIFIVEDDGRGFEPEKAETQPGGKGLGIIGMRERAALSRGTLEIESSPGIGTTVIVRMPVPNSA
jgi:PAS domain S-box-containing protein